MRHRAKNCSRLGVTASTIVRVTSILVEIEKMSLSAMQIFSEHPRKKSKTEENKLLQKRHQADWN